MKIQIHFQICENLMEFIEIESKRWNLNHCNELEFSFIFYKYIYKNITETLLKQYLLDGITICGFQFLLHNGVVKLKIFCSNMKKL